MGMRTTRRVGVQIALAVLTLGLAASPARAHDVRASLAFWGNFGTDAAACQRIVSHAATLCVTTAVNLRSACMEAQLGGGDCNQAGLDEQLQAARDRARHLVEDSCSLSQLQNLRFLTLEDAVNDVLGVCRDVEAATTSAVYGPAMVGGSVGAVDETTHTCIATVRAGARKLLRYAARARQGAFDRIAKVNLGPSLKQALVDRTAQRIARAQTLIGAQIDAACPNGTFESVYSRSVSDFVAGIAQRGDCIAAQAYVQNAVTCPSPVCGNGMQEPGEECDDGNTYDGDGCLADCKKANCDVFPSTYDLIQKAIFENHGCASDACHGSGRSGGLDLRAGVSYDNLIDVAAETVPGFKRVDPGNRENSLLWLNLAANTLPNQFQAPLRGMPLGLDPLSPDELEAMRIWIAEGGAARSSSIKGTAQLLNACLPEPKPAQIEPLPPPAPGTGVQMHMPSWTLQPGGEAEVCFSSYYDFSGQVPAYALSEDGTRFRYKKVDIRQDPLSHHLIVDLYRGPEPANDPVWGTYTCKGGPLAGTVCDPLNLGFCGNGGDCATEPDPQAIACIGFGPQNSLTTLTTGGFAFAQQTATEFRYPQDVYDEIPIRGIVLWNSHAFNLTHRAGGLQAWVNVYFPEPQEIQFKQTQIFDASKIFWNESFFPLPEVAPFQTNEFCQIHVFHTPSEPAGMSPEPIIQPNQAVHLFELSGHTHRHGKRFQILRGAFACKGGANRGQPCSPFNAAMCPRGTCADDGGHDPQSSILYTNLIYNDPVRARFDPPLLFSGSAARSDRALTFCALYDNGAAPNIEDVKRRSASPPPGSVFGFEIGGPCALAKTRCIGGPQHNKLCNGNNAVCESTPGAGDGDCDACPLTGGFRTEDEMFILFGNYWVE
jgi:cysteine-rich repeat protein